MNLIGTENRPMGSQEPMKVARDLASDVFATASRLRGLWCHHGQFYVWYADQWKALSVDDLESQVWLELEDAWVLGTDGATKVRFKPTTWKVKEVVRCLAAVCRLPHEQVPCWLAKPEPEWQDTTVMVPFLDALLNVKTGKACVRDAYWFDPMCIPVKWSDGAPCPTWERCLRQWSEGDRQWVGVLQKWFGYCLMGHKLYGRWLLMHGKVRSGKGTIMHVLSKLMPNQVVHMNLTSLSGRWGLGSIFGKKVLGIVEAHAVEFQRASEAAHLIKVLVGNDPVTMERKYKEPMEVHLQTAVMMQCNMIPEMPNEAAGLSAKMLPLPFNVSFLGKEDPHLKQKLEQELEGIARWAVEGAKKLVDGDGDFGMAKKAEALREAYERTNSPLQAFLETRFVQKPTGFVSFRRIRAMYVQWCKSMGIKPLPVLHLPRRMEQQCTWPLERYRTPETLVRGYRGISTRKEYDDEASL